jgi:hypothetical protein
VCRVQYCCALNSVVCQNCFLLIGPDKLTLLRNYEKFGPETQRGMPSPREILSFHGIQTRVVTGLLTGHNTLRRHLHIMGLYNDPMCRKCGTEEETSFHILCECEALASLRYAHLGSFFLDPEDIRELGVGAIWNFVKGIGLL